MWVCYPSCVTNDYVKIVTLRAKLIDTTATVVVQVSVRISAGLSLNARVSRQRSERIFERTLQSSLSEVLHWFSQRTLLDAEQSIDTLHLCLGRKGPLVEGTSVVAQSINGKLVKNSFVPLLPEVEATYDSGEPRINSDLASNTRPTLIPEGGVNPFLRDWSLVRLLIVGILSFLLGLVLGN